RVGASQGDSSGDGSGENLVVKRAQVGVVPGWVTEWEVLSATPLRSIEARGNGVRRPVGVGPVGLPLCRNKAVRVGWADVGGAEAWASYQLIGTQSGQYLSSDPGWWGLTDLHVCVEGLAAQISQLRLLPTLVDEIKQAQEQSQNELFQRLRERAQRGELPDFEIRVDEVMRFRGRMVIPKEAP
ncbi:hypothetical protein ACLOJK_025588, partial [Asimina triloba]